MDGVREFQISIEYQVYCLFYCFESFLKLKPSCRIWQQFKWTNGRSTRKLPFSKLKQRHKKYVFLSL